MLRDLTIYNPENSTNQRKRLPDISKLGIGTLNTIWKGNFMECTWTIQPKRMTNGVKKIRRINNPTKREGNSIQGIVKIQPETVEVVKTSLYPHR